MARGLDDIIFWNAVITKPIARCADGRPPCAEDARRLVAGAEVFGELFVKPLLAQSRFEAFRMDLTPYKERLAMCIHDLAFGAPHHHAIEEATVIQHRLWRVKEMVVEQIDQRPELKIVALVRRRGEEHQVARVTAQRFHQPVVLCRLHFASVPLAADVVCLVHDDQVEARSIEHALHPHRPFQCVDGGDDARVSFPLGWGVIVEVDAENLELHSEAIAQLILPVLD